LDELALDDIYVLYYNRSIVRIKARFSKHLLHSEVGWSWNQHSEFRQVSLKTKSRKL